MIYEEIYKQMALKHLGREPEANEGSSDEQIRQTEKRLGFKLPESLRVYYQITGNLPKLNKVHNRLLNLLEIDIEDDFLIFMGENQNVVYWGIKTSDLSNPDPEIWQIINEEPPECYSEEKPLSEFIVEMMSWQFGELQESEN